MTTLERATEVYESGHCPGCGLPFTQVSVDADYHNPEDGSPVGHELGAARCPWTSDDLYTTELIATGVVKVGGSPPPAGLDDKLATLADHRDKVVDLARRTIAQLQEDEANDRMLRAEWDDRDGAA